MKQRAIEYFFKHRIDSEFSNEYFRHTGIDLLNIQKPYPFYDLLHAALTHKLNITHETSESLGLNERIVCYTDGSKSLRRVGAGFCLMFDKK
jgi:hypothetical protein